MPLQLAMTVLAHNKAADDDNDDAVEMTDECYTSVSRFHDEANDALLFIRRFRVIL
jgi:hypothetical protein